MWQYYKLPEGIAAMAMWAALGETIAVAIRMDNGDPSLFWT